MGEPIVVDHALSIDADLLHFEVSRSGGPGGQHVNKTSTRVRLRFDMSSCEAMSATQKDAVRRAHPGKITNDGALLLVCDSHRSQARNMAEVRERLASLLRDAMKPKIPRKPSRPTKASRRKRLTQKRQRGKLKESRQRVNKDGE